MEKIKGFAFALVGLAMVMTPVAVDAVESEDPTIVDLAVGTPDLSTLVDLVVSVDLVDALNSEGPLTVFAPTNEAFMDMPGVDAYWWRRADADLFFNPDFSDFAEKLLELAEIDSLIKVNNDPFVIEYNVRMGDPEAESVIPRIKSDLLDLFEGVAMGDIGKRSLELDPRYSAAVFLVSGGYPGSYEKNKVISGLDQAQNSILFHAGTRRENEQVLTSGGRVLAINSYGKTMDEALAQSFRNAELINFEGKYFRTDLGNDLKTEK